MCFVKRIILWLCSLFPTQMRKIAYFIIPRDMININLNLTDPNQKRVLISYLSLLGVDVGKVTHANYHHFNQMINYFVNRGYCVDTCFCLDEKAFGRLKHNRYNLLIGFGKAFKSFCSQLEINKRILFITENNPEVVKARFNERLIYFKKRHPKMNTKTNYVRDEYFDKEQLLLCDEIILMNSKFNAGSFGRYGKRLWTINANALFNKSYVFDEEQVRKWIPESKRRFLWFGSDGFIHKGCDIILDAFRQLPEYQVDFYGISISENSMFKKLCPPNAHNCGRVNVQTEEFIEKVVSRHCFLLFPSCSEGMSTAVCTCMAHGIIPIVTKEAGFEPHSSILVLKDWTVEGLSSMIEKAASMRDDEILSLRVLAYNYAHDQFSLKKFSSQFASIMDRIIGDNNISNEE